MDVIVVIVVVVVVYICAVLLFNRYGLPYLRKIEQLREEQLEMDYHLFREEIITMGEEYLRFRGHEKTHESPPVSEPVSCWSVLGIDSNATGSEIKRAFARLVKDFHPDTAPNGQGNLAKFTNAIRARDEALRIVASRPTH